MFAAVLGVQDYSPGRKAAQLLAVLYQDRNPFSLAANVQPEYRKTFSNLRHEDAALALSLTNASLWVEVGSFLGRSAITTAEVIKKQRTGTQVVCIDPWTGAVGQWLWHGIPSLREPGYQDFDHLQMDTDGAVRLYEKFLANIVGVGHQDVILPLRASSIVGMKLLISLHAKGLLAHRPQVIYLDSAHEMDETYLELTVAWELLAPGGVLMGDDWSWNAVAHDLRKFVAMKNITSGLAARDASVPVPGITLIKGSWFVLKPLAESAHSQARQYSPTGPVAAIHSMLSPTTNVLQHARAHLQGWQLPSG